MNREFLHDSFAMRPHCAGADAKLLRDLRTGGTLDDVTQNLVVIAALDAQALPDIDWPRAGTGAAGRPLSDMWAPVEYLQAKVFLAGLTWD